MQKPPQNHPKTTLFAIIALFFSCVSYGVGVIVYERYLTFVGAFIANALTIANVWLYGKMLIAIYNQYCDSMEQDDTPEQDQQSFINEAPSVTMSMAMPAATLEAARYIKTNDMVSNCFHISETGVPTAVTSNHVTTRINAMPEVERGENNTCYIPISTVQKCRYNIGLYLCTYEKLPNGKFAATGSQVY